MEISEKHFKLDILLQETLELTEFISLKKDEEIYKKENSLDVDYLFDLADSALSNPVDFLGREHEVLNIKPQKTNFPDKCGIIYRIDDAVSTFCIRGFSVSSIKESMIELQNYECTKRAILKLNSSEDLNNVFYFQTKSVELAESIREQIINRRFPKFEDSVCNISDPGFSWWMDVSLKEGEGRFEIFFKAHSVNRAEKYIQLGPIGDGIVAALRLNQARTLLRSSFPISEFVCTDRSLTVVTNKPDHLSFISFKNIFLLGENHTDEENFPDNTLGRTLYFYFHELAVIRKFWIEVQNRLS